MESALGDLGTGGYNGSTGKIKDKPSGKPEPLGLSFGHFPFRSWPKPKSEKYLSNKMSDHPDRGTMLITSLP